MRYSVYFRGSEIDPVDSASSQEDLQAKYDKDNPYGMQGRFVVVPSNASAAVKDAARLGSRGITYCYDYHVEGREAKFDADCKAKGYTHKSVLEWTSKHQHQTRPVRCYVYSFTEFTDDAVARFAPTKDASDTVKCVRSVL